MRLVIAARRSDLARLQAKTVATALAEVAPHLRIEFLFKASLGDLDLDTPLVTMGNKGVFTQDFHADLMSGHCDLVVHSWKDLPTENSVGTEVVATLPRADARDLLLVHPDRWQREICEILSSSPRRIYNLAAFLPQAWPHQTTQFRFTAVRGNIPTRLRKWREGDATGLVVAKAAIDRLLLAEAEEFREARDAVQEALSASQWMVLPLSQNPAAPAQGALAIEIRADRDDLRELLAKINDDETFRAVTRERQALAAYGGGCHQKIGISVLPREYGVVYGERGQTDRGEILHAWRLESERSSARAESAAEIFPESPKVDGWFERQPLAADHWQARLLAARDLYIARANALPEGFTPARSQLLWTAGIQTWQALAKRGVWVNGSSDGLGETEPSGLGAILGRQPDWLYLSHDLAGTDGRRLATYRLRPRANPPDLRGKKFFYWMSGSAFREAWRLAPDILRSGHHACGPGKTRAEIRRVLGREPKVYLTWQEWRSAVLKG